MASEQTRKQADKVADHLASFPGVAHTTTTRPVIRELMLRTEGFLTVNGRIWDIKVQYLGVGVYRVGTTMREAGRYE